MLFRVLVERGTTDFLFVRNQSAFARYAVVRSELEPIKKERLFMLPDLPRNSCNTCHFLTPELQQIARIAGVAGFELLGEKIERIIGR